MKWLQASEGAVLIRFEEYAGVRRSFEALIDWKHPALLNLHPAYASLLIEFDPLQASYADFCKLVEERLAFPAKPTKTARRVEIPVLYDGEDLEAVGQWHGLRKEEVIALHSGAEYEVLFLGFQPGFPYLGGLPGKLETPRLSSPRLKVPAGSVAIAGKQAGIYPRVSAGGWRLLGRTPLKLFTPPQSTLLQMGDRVKFRPISREDFGDV